MDASEARSDGGAEGDRDPDPPLSSGDPIGEYRVVRLLGAGATGSVYESRRAEGDERVAIKVLHRRCSVDPRALSRFSGEARAVQRIGHPNIVRILAMGELADGRRYHVMELVEGGTLSQLIASRGALSADETLPILRGVAGALEAAHGQGIAHRDLKPDNVLVARDAGGAAVPKLVDFGLAKLVTPEAKGGTLTETGQILGTPHYMAPEQSRGSGVDHRADVYSFGILAYRLLTGRLPFTGEDPLEVLLQHRREPAVPPSRLHAGLTAAADAPILAMLAKTPDQRPSSVATAFAELERALRGPHVRARRLGTARVAIAAVLLLLMAVALALAVGIGTAPDRQASQRTAVTRAPRSAPPVHSAAASAVTVPRVPDAPASAPLSADSARPRPAKRVVRHPRATEPGPEDPERAFP